jgi:uncharacterized protein
VDALHGTHQGRGPAARPERASGGGTPDGSFDPVEELAMFFFVAVPVLGAVLTGVFGRKLGSLLTAGGGGGMAWWY